MNPPTCRCHALATLVVAFLPVLAYAAPIPTDVLDKDISPAEKIKKQLDQPITLEISDQSINAALNQIREQTKLNFVVDRFAIQQMGYDPEQMPVSVKLKDAKARSCLRAVLSPYNLGYAIIGDTVLVSTEDMAIYRQMRQRVSIDLEKVDLAAALKKLSKETATNLLLDSRVPAKDAKTEVTLQMEDVPLETAVRLMAETAGLKPVKVGNVFLVTTKAIANELRNDPDLQQQQPPGGGPPIPGGAMMWAPNGNNLGIFMRGGNWAAGINPNTGDILQPGNIPIPPLEKPAEKSADDDPPEKDKKPDKTDPQPTKKN